jgi:hypothetical protein
MIFIFVLISFVVNYDTYGFYHSSLDKFSLSILTIRLYPL